MLGLAECVRGQECREGLHRVGGVGRCQLASQGKGCSWTLNGQSHNRGKETAEVSQEAMRQGALGCLWKSEQGCFSGGKACKRREELGSGDLPQC